MTIVELTQLIMRQEGMGWSKAMAVAMDRREAAEQRKAQEAERTRERRAGQRGQAQEED